MYQFEDILLACKLLAFSVWLLRCKWEHILLISGKIDIQYKEIYICEQLCQWPDMKMIGVIIPYWSPSWSMDYLQNLSITRINQ